jgi:LPS sulfotransferase NodH
MKSISERQFRETLAWLLDALDEAMPEYLWSEAWDHLYRRDGQGNTLCFASPLRADLLERLLPWLEAEAPDAAARLCQASVPQRWPGPHHEALPLPRPPTETTQQPPLLTQE